MLIKSLIPPKNFSLALSGGQDSLGACYFLLKKGYRFTAIHLNNKLIEQDDLCAEKVREFCKQFKIPVIIKDCDNKYKKGSIEGFARECRNEFFSSIGGDIITAHHVDDCVSSYLWNVMRGHADRMPIPEKTVFPNHTIWRPFLLSKKSDFAKLIFNIREFVTEDELNSDLSLTRNWIREKIVKEINSKNYNLTKVVGKIVRQKLLERGFVIP